MAAGPATTAFLAGLGADVLKVEPPSGDGTRWVHPRQHGIGTNFISMNAGKRDAILDLKSAEGRDKALELASSADVLLQNLAGGVVERLGLGHDAVRPKNPRLIYCSISGYGRTGPMASERGHDLAMQAFSGFARLNGGPGDELEHFRFSGFVDLITAATAANAILAALVERDRSGLGQEISVSMLEASLEAQYTRFNAYLTGIPLPEPDGSRGRLVAPDRAYHALDQDIFVTVQDDAEWRRFCEAIECPSLAEDPTYRSNELRLRNVATLDEVVGRQLKERPAIYWLRRLRRADVAAVTARSLHQIAFDRQVSENAMAVELDSIAGPIMLGGLPWHFSRTPGEVRTAPTPGGDTEEVEAIAAAWREWQASGAAVQAGGGGSAAILDGYRVVDLSRGVPGRLAALRLQDLGARVLRVAAAGGNVSRDLDNLEALLDRGKERTVIDDSEDGARALEGLLRSADIVVCDRAERGALQAAVEAERAASERGLTGRIWVDITEFGGRGPLSGDRGSELTVQAVAGYTEWLGKHGGEPVRLGADVASCATATFAVGAALAGLFRRSRGGSGQRVELSMLNSLISLATIHVAGQYDPDDFEGPRVLGPFYPPQAGWRTKGRPIAFSFGGAVGESGRPGWMDFVSLIGADWLLKDERFSQDPSGRSTTGIGPLAQECKPEYEKAFADFDDEVLVEAIRKCGGVAASYLSYADLVSHEQLKALGVIQAAPDGSGQVTRATAFPAHFSRTELALRWAPATSKQA